jgi:hypothetical protein
METNSPLSDGEGRQKISDLMNAHGSKPFQKLATNWTSNEHFIASSPYCALFQKFIQHFLTEFKSALK